MTMDSINMTVGIDKLTEVEQRNLVLRLKLLQRIFKQEEYKEQGIFTFDHFLQIWHVALLTTYKDPFVQAWLKEYLHIDRGSQYLQTY